MNNWLDIHPKIAAAGVGGGLVLIGDGIASILGVPAPGWLTPLVSVLVPLIFGYLKKP